MEPETGVLAATLPSTRLGRNEVITGEVLVARSDVMLQLLGEVRRIARTEAKVLITGESGVGKELVATYIHRHSRRASAPLIAVNCAGMPETLLESELFGHVRGSFTGAYRDKLGRFEQAHRGTLFLDEVGEMSLRMQGLLLRVLETGELQKVGADRAQARTDVRVITATNRDLPSLVREGVFREDLYYRLNVVHVHVPPLRDRRDDIPALADHFLQQALPSGDRTCVFAPEVYAAMQAYDWPGNVRQLNNVIQRLAINAHDGTITAAHLPMEIQRVVLPTAPQPLRERRRTTADQLYERMMRGESFWTAVYEPFMHRDIARGDVRAVVGKALREVRGNYRVVTRVFNIAPNDYKRFLNFLRKHGCLLPYREFR